MSVTHRASINNLPDKSRLSAGRTVHEGHGNRNGTDEVVRTDNGSIQSHLLCPVLLLLFITEIILLLTLLYSSLLYCFSLAFPPLLVGLSALCTRQTIGMKDLYSHRKETIERIFGTAKENHGFRYTQMYGKARMKMKVALTFACMNLKKLAKCKKEWGLQMA